MSEYSRNVYESSIFPIFEKQRSDRLDQTPNFCSLADHCLKYANELSKGSLAQRPGSQGRTDRSGMARTCSAKLCKS